MIIGCPSCRCRYDVSGRKAGTRARCRCGTILRVPKVDAAVSTLSCPTCGAACSPDDSQCKYCQSTLAAVACSACFGRVFAGSAHCPHCGAEVLLPARDAPDQANRRTCPRCRGSTHDLVAHLLGETVLDECNVCGGVWVDAVTFDHLVKSRDEQAALAVSGGPYLTLESYSKASPDAQATRYLPCPECGQLMNRKNFATTSGVIVDVCKAHGIWFDRDELGRIVQFIMKGGLDTARRRELETLEQKLQNRREQLAGLGGGLGGGWGSDASVGGSADKAAKAIALVDWVDVLRKFFV